MKGFIIPRKWMTIIGVSGFGLIILVFGIYAVTSIFSWHVKALLGIGIAGILAFWVENVITSRSARYGSNVAVMILLAFSILVLVNFVSARHFSRIDTTEGKKFSLSEQTEKILKGLTQDISVTAFYTEDHYRRRIAEDILNEYAQRSPKVHVTFIDPASKPGLASAYKIRQNGTVVFELGDKRESVESYQNEEQDFTSAILKLLSTEQKKVYFLSGHGEKDIDSYDDDSYGELRKMIEADNYQVEKLILAGQAVVPGDCSVLVIAGPQKPLLPQEEMAITEYINRGGKAIIMVDPSPSPSLSETLSGWGIDVRDDIVLDGFGRSLLGDPSIPVTVKYAYHAITTPIARVMTFFPMARSIASKKDSGKYEVVELVQTSDDSWGEADTQMLLSERRARYDDGKDRKGPLCVAVAVTMKEKSKDKPEEEEKEKRMLVVIGDSDFVTNRYLQQANPDLFMNALNWLTEAEELISIRPKAQELQEQIQKLTGRQLRFITYSSIFAVPVLLIIFGGRVWWKRR